MKLVVSALVALALVPVAAAADVTIVSRDVPLHLGGRSLAAAAPRRFNMVGLHWQGSGAPFFRTRAAGGRWSKWLEADDDWGRSGSWRKSNPEWTGTANAIQYRLRGKVSRLRAYFLWSPVSLVPMRKLSIAGSPSIIPRSGWQADETIRRAAPQYAPTLSFALVHHTVNTNNYSPEQSAAMVRGIEVYHVKGNGWNDIGYNFLVDKYGQIFEGRGGGIDQPVIGAQAEGWNRLSTGVANIGTFSTVTQTPEAIDAIARLLGWKMTLHGVPCEGTVVVTSGGGSTNRYAYGTQVTMQRISGHRDGCSTECPGNALYAQLPDIRTKSTAHAGALPATPRITCVPQAAQVDYGQDAVFSGVATSADGTPAAGLNVSLQKIGNNGTWVTIEHPTTGADGAWSARHRWVRTGRIRALVDAAVSPSTVVEMIPLLQARSRTTRVQAGGVVAVSGSVQPSAAVRVLIERKDRGGRWRRVSDAGVKVRSGQFSANFRLKTAGLYRLTTRTGPVAAPALYVRAVRSATDVPPPSGGTPAT